MISQETTQFANQSQIDLSDMETAMRHMENASKAISSRLEAINEKAENITTVVTTITKVADQTNLLSLNAAIEAEKAGEYGRGFTVVAREIRRLADQTAVATLDIERMVSEMQMAVSAGVMEMDKFIAEVRHSAENVEHVSLQLTSIIQQVQTLSPRFEDVNTAMGRQSDHAQDINSAMLRLSDEMQRTKESLHETYSAIAQLNDAARGLQQQVSQFQLNPA
jgi:methyl-accepting chemotaxis protein WspA